MDESSFDSLHLSTCNNTLHHLLNFFAFSASLLQIINSCASLSPTYPPSSNSSSPWKYTSVNSTSLIKLSSSLTSSIISTRLFSLPSKCRLHLSLQEANKNRPDSCLFLLPPLSSLSKITILNPSIYSSMDTNSSQSEIYEPEFASTWLNETVSASRLFKVVGYSFDKIGAAKSVLFGSFTVGGYKFSMRYITQCYDDCLAFALDLQSGETDVKARVIFTLHDRSGSPSTLSKNFLHVFGGRVTYCVEREQFEASNCLKNDTFEIICSVTVVKESRFESTKVEPVMVPPSNLDEQLSHLLESGLGADVTFEVSGETFRGHKLILGARSPVFRAHFFGPMNDKGVECVRLDDIETEVFRVFLHFIYSDSVSELEETIVDSGDSKQDAMIMYQHLLAVADRYEVERLKLLCENKLSKNIKVENFATTFTLAEQHNCSHLKASCFKFAKSPKILAAVTKTDGFEHLFQSCPSILKELIENTSSE
ncbi:hypothetical protein LUZ60_002566 [Juncus effusus]|nr:hypothetical protein LUZ60_002566 [Juncus effusus]